jgi:CheY-like chemotaxis protein
MLRSITMPTILIVEDNKINREMLSRRLDRKGFHVVSAADGREGIAQAQSQFPDLILMDMSMPVLDGWSATRQLKASPATRTIPIIALTAHAMLGDREKALDAGCDDYEMKPVDLSRLLIKIQALLDKPSGQAAEAPVGQVLDLLVVDDNQANRDLLARRLGRAEYRVTKAASGREALDLIKAAPRDLVLLDSMMPEMSGLEVLRAIRASHSIIDLPVIMVTDKEDTNDVVTALEMGANDFVTRPLNFPVVLARINTQLSLKRARDARPVAAAARSTEAPAAARGSSPGWRDARPKPAAETVHGTARSRNGHGDAPTAVLAEAMGDTWVQGMTRVDPPTLAGYEILAELGRGGMGIVYKARHERMNRMVALKVIDKHYLTNPDAIRRFYREIQAVAQLAHPNIVLGYDAGQFGETHYFAMEYVEGTDLGTFVKQRGPLPVEDAVHVALQAAAGLQHAHERNLVHRDIKPSNLLATWSGVVPATPVPNRRLLPEATLQPLHKAMVKILDMGLALLHQPTELSEAAAALTRDNHVVGTADYMAPEQWMNANKVDIRADLYSLGCTLYHLLTGEVPFPSVESMEKMLKHHLDEPEPLERVRPGVPPHVAGAVRRLMAKKPDHRFQKPADLIDALK